MSDFQVCAPLLAFTDEDKHTAVVGCALAELSIADTGTPVPINEVTGNHVCPFQPTTEWTCPNG